MLGNLSEYFVVLTLKNAVIMTVLMSTHNHHFSSKKSHLSNSKSTNNEFTMYLNFLYLNEISCIATK